jgi:hypothetical protein
MGRHRDDDGDDGDDDDDNDLDSDNDFNNGVLGNSENLELGRVLIRAKKSTREPRIREFTPIRDV